MARFGLEIDGIEYNKAYIKDFRCTSQISTDASSVNYGVIPATGSVSMIDINDKILGDINAGALNYTNAMAKVKLNGGTQAELLTDDSNYDITEKTLDIDFIDRLSVLDNVTYGGMALRDTSATAREMLDDVIGSYGSYVKECPSNWVVYNNIKAVKQSKSTISVSVDSNAAKVGTPINFVGGKKHTLIVAYAIPSTYGGQIRMMVVKSEPDGSSISSEDIVDYTFLSSSTTAFSVAKLEFLSSIPKLYLVMDFSTVATGQTVDVEIKKIMFDEVSIQDSLYNNVYYLEPNKDDESGIITYTPITTTVFHLLENTIIEYPYLESATYRKTFDKFCNAFRLTVALDKDGKLQFYDARPNQFEIDDTIYVPRSYQKTRLKKQLFLKNKIGGVDIKQSKSVVSINYNELCSTQEFDVTGYLTNSYNNTAQNSVSDVDGNRPRAKAFFDGYYATLGVKIPQKEKQGLEEIIQLLSGENDAGIPYISYSVAWKKISLTTSANSFDGEITIKESLINEPIYNSGDIVNASADGLPSFSVEGLKSTVDVGGYPMVYLETELENKSTIFSKNLFSLTDDGYWVGTISILVGKRSYFLGENYDYTSREYSYSGYGYLWMPEKVTVSFNGNIKTISFEEIDLSTSGAENASNVVSIPANELMQSESFVTNLRDEIMRDYASGINTATVDLFCGTKAGYQDGEIIQPNELLRFSTDNTIWKVTGRTLSYNGAPTMSLELQAQKRYKEIEWEPLDVFDIDTEWSNGYKTVSGSINSEINIDPDKYKPMVEVSILAVGEIEGGQTKDEEIIVKTACRHTGKMNITVGDITETDLEYSYSYDGKKFDWSTKQHHYDVNGKAVSFYIVQIIFRKMWIYE